MASGNERPSPFDLVGGSDVPVPFDQTLLRTLVRRNYNASSVCVCVSTFCTRAHTHALGVCVWQLRTYQTLCHCRRIACPPQNPVLRICRRDHQHTTHNTNAQPTRTDSTAVNRVSAPTPTAIVSDRRQSSSSIKSISRQLFQPDYNIHKSIPVELMTSATSLFFFFLFSMPTLASMATAGWDSRQQNWTVWNLAAI